MCNNSKSGLFRVLDSDGKFAKDKALQYFYLWHMLNRWPQVLSGCLLQKMNKTSTMLQIQNDVRLIDCSDLFVVAVDF